MADNLPIQVLGLDLASSRYSAIGTALLRADHLQIQSVQLGCLDWKDPKAKPTVRELAEQLMDYVQLQGIQAVGCDGPLGWRDPQAHDREGVGRWCEKLANTQGKTGIPGKTYPQTQLGWTQFSIDLSQWMVEHAGATIVNHLDCTALLPVLPRPQFYWYETFPTATWRKSGLKPLPAKSKSKPADWQWYADQLGQTYDITVPAVTSHDDLQAVVAALPGLGLLGAPILVEAVGTPSFRYKDIYYEGVIYLAASS